MHVSCGPSSHLFKDKPTRDYANLNAKDNADIVHLSHSPLLMGDNDTWCCAGREGMKATTPEEAPVARAQRTANRFISFSSLRWLLSICLRQGMSRGIITAFNRLASKFFLRTRVARRRRQGDVKCSPIPP